MPAARMAFDYIGPTGSFASSTHSIADLLDGRIPMSRLHDKDVVIGATASRSATAFRPPLCMQRIHVAISIIILWGTGFGPTNPAAPIGQETPSDQIYSVTNVPTVQIGATAAKVIGAALSPGAAGLYQIVVQVPQSLATGEQPVIVQTQGGPGRLGRRSLGWTMSFPRRNSRENADCGVLEPWKRDIRSR